MPPKLSKSEVGYEHPAKGRDHCSWCKHFLPASKKCEIVEGWIAPEDWCRRFVSGMRVERQIEGLKR